MPSTAPPIASDSVYDESRPTDLRGRPMRDLRVSVTDRCDFRCSYCMPEADYTWLPRQDILSFEEIATIVEAFASMGVTKVRLTGGEPLLRRDLPSLVARICALPAITDVGLTTNAGRLRTHARALRSAGLSRVTVSLDTLRADRHYAITRRDTHAAVLDGIASLVEADFTNTKLNAVVMRGVNDDELADIVEFASGVGAEPRFIEYMDVGGATRWSPTMVVSAAQILLTLSEVYGPLTPIDVASSAPARRYRLTDGRVFGIVASTTAPFCGSCDRSRLTADGVWYRCLYATEGTDLRALVRSEPSVLRRTIASQWQTRDDQGAVDRFALGARASAVPVELLRRDPHLEMHTRGG